MRQVNEHVIVRLRSVNLPDGRKCIPGNVVADVKIATRPALLGPLSRIREVPITQTNHQPLTSLCADHEVVWCIHLVKRLQIQWQSYNDAFLARLEAGAFANHRDPTQIHCATFQRL